MVSFTKCTEYKIEQVRAAVAQIFANHNMSKVIAKNTKVLLKPNLVMRAKPERCATTHPLLVQAVAEAVVALGGIVTIADSPGGLYNPALMQRFYDETGMTEAAKASGAALNLDCSASKKNGFDIITPIHKADVIINLPKLKTHVLALYSGAVKNLYGVIPGTTKGFIHARKTDAISFCNLLLDLCETVKPTFNIMDAVIGMEGDGPTGGSPRKFGAIIASESAYELDFAACESIGLKYKEVPTLFLAHTRKLCANNVDDLKIIGDYKSYKVDFVKPRSDHWINKNFLTKFFPTMPFIDHNKCVRCKICLNNCPAKTIASVNGKIEINHSNCIKCFCCHEMCPPTAITLKRKLMLKQNKKSTEVR